MYKKGYRTTLTITPETLEMVKETKFDKPNGRYETNDEYILRLLRFYEHGDRTHYPHDYPEAG